MRKNKDKFQATAGDGATQINTPMMQKNCEDVVLDVVIGSEQKETLNVRKACGKAI